jgi:hypothetical protein
LVSPTLKSRGATVAYVITRNGFGGQDGLHILDNTTWNLDWNETRVDIAREGEETERKDKIICLWFTTDLYLFEGGQHAQIQNICCHRVFVSQISKYSWKKMKLST